MIDFHVVDFGFMDRLFQWLAYYFSFFECLMDRKEQPDLYMEVKFDICLPASTAASIIFLEI